MKRIENDPEILKHALIGYESQHAEIEKRIADLRRQLRIRDVANDAHEVTNLPRPKKNRISVAGRKRLAANLRERWRKARAAGRTTLG